MKKVIIPRIETDVLKNINQKVDAEYCMLLSFTDFGNKYVQLKY